MSGSIYDWSKTAANNATADGDINWAEGQAPSTVNDSARAMMKRLAEFVADTTGTLTAGGSANAITVTANSAFTTYADGRFVSLEIATDNTGAATLNVNSIGAKSIRKMLTTGESALTGGELQAAGVYDFKYQASLNSAAGGWLLLNPTQGITNIVTTVLTTSGTYTKPDGLKFVEVTCVGGGAGGTGAGATSAGQSSAGGGGGGGGTVIKLYAAADLSATETYTVGAKGGAPGGSGAAGGDTAFKGLTAGGGNAPGAINTTGAAAGTTPSPGVAGTGGSASGGDLNIAGGHGWHGMRAMMGVATQGSPGVGGVSHLTNVNSFGFQVIGSSVDGVTGRFPGGGGSGGANGASQSAASGAVGGDGCIILKEYF